MLFFRIAASIATADAAAADGCWRLCCGGSGRAGCFGMARGFAGTTTSPGALVVAVFGFFLQPQSKLFTAFGFRKGESEL